MEEMELLEVIVETIEVREDGDNRGEVREEYAMDVAEEGNGGR